MTQSVYDAPSQHDVVESLQRCEDERRWKKRKKNRRIIYQAQRVIETLYMVIDEKTLLIPRSPFRDFLYFLHSEYSRHTAVVAQHIAESGKDVKATHQPDWLWSTRWRQLMQEYNVPQEQGGVLWEVPLTSRQSKYFNPIKTLSHIRLYDAAIYEQGALFDTTGNNDAMGNVLSYFFTSNILIAVVNILAEQYMQYVAVRGQESDSANVELAYDIHVFSMLQDASISAKLSDDIPWEWQEPLLNSTILDQIRSGADKLWGLLYDLDTQRYEL